MQDWIRRNFRPILLAALAATTGCSKTEQASSAPSAAAVPAPAPAMAASAARPDPRLEESVRAYPAPTMPGGGGGAPSGDPGGVAGTPGVVPGPGASAPGDTGQTAGTAGVRMDEPHDKVE